MIYELRDPPGFVISSGGSWLPGFYATRQAARFALRLLDCELRHLVEHTRPAAITMADLRSVVRARQGRRVRA